jgi:PEP-CTERM motif
MNLSNRSASVVSTFAALLILVAPVWGQIIYTQPWNLTSNAYASQNDTISLGNFAAVYDQFTVSGPIDIIGVDWTGAYFNPPNQGPITGWSVGFYADNGGIPGVSLGSFYASGNGNETFLTTAGGYPFYSYSATTDFFVPSNALYWLSVVPDLGYQPQWGWGASTTGPGTGYQCFFGSCYFLPAAGVNLAFDLIGKPVPTPEPGTLVLLGSGFVGIAGLLRRKINL